MRAAHSSSSPGPVFDDDAKDALSAKLTSTEWAQPAIGVSTSAALDVLGRFGVAFDAYAGHSFGEVSALYAAGAFDVSTFVGIARSAESAWPRPRGRARVRCSP